jgi:hypothetical protein
VSSVYNFAYLKDLVLKKLQGDAYFSTLDIENALNESQDDLAIFTKANLVKALFVVTVGQDTYDWPTDALAINGINVNGLELDEITQEEWRKQGGLSPFNSANPIPSSSFCIQGKKIILYPMPGDASLPTFLFYIPKPAELVTDAQVPVVDRVFTKPWVHLAVSNLLETDGKRLEEASYHYGMYLKRRAENAVNENQSRKRKFRNTYPRAIRF